MPKELENKLRREAIRKFAGIKDPKKREEKIDAFTYGVMRKTGWVPKREQR